MNDITQLRNKYAGKRVFVIGNGPSIKNTNLNLLRDEYSFAMNRISAIYIKTQWRPSFFICTTTNVKDIDWRNDILQSINLGIPTFIWDKLESYLPDNNNILKMKCTNGSEISDDPPFEWWSYDIEKRVTKFGTSMIVAIQIAVYMGFKHIYILGADLDFKDSFMKKIFFKLKLRKIGLIFDKNHFSNRYGTPGLNSSALNKNMIGAHKLTKKACAKVGVKIYNATIGGALEVYERVNYHTLF